MNAPKPPGAASSSGVSVLLPTFNRAAYLPRSLDSVLAQTVKPMQIIVINDGSSDATEEALAPYRDRIEYIRQDNGGKGAALNAGLPHVRGRYIWVFDDDDIAFPDALERHLAILEAEPQIGFTYSGYFTSVSDPATGELVPAGSRPPRPFADVDDFMENLLCCYLPSPCVVVRTEVQRQAGPYHEHLQRVDDFEMSIRWGLVAPSTRIADVRRPTFHQRQHSGTRGRAGQHYSSSDIVWTTRRDSRKALRELADRLELRHYLPRDAWAVPLDAAAVLRATVRRWAVHMQKGMWPEAFADFPALSAQPSELWDAYDDVTRFGMRAFLDVYMLQELSGDPVTMAALRVWLGHPNLAALRSAVARQLYYRMAVDVRCRDTRNLGACMKIVRGLFGWIGFPGSVLQHRLRRALATHGRP